MKKFIFSTAKRKNYILRIVCWLAVILYVGGIFYLSNQNGTQSNKISKEIITEIKHYVKVPAVIRKEHIVQHIDYNAVLRKCTHFLEYFILALIVYFSLRFCGVRTKTTNLISLTFCIIYASLDEFHQSFIFERTPSVTDVMIDVSGGILALLLLFFWRTSKQGI